MHAYCERRTQQKLTLRLRVLALKYRKEHSQSIRAELVAPTLKRAAALSGRGEIAGNANDHRDECRTKHDDDLKMRSEFASIARGISEAIVIK